MSSPTSRHGFSRCPSCNAHVRTAEAETQAPSACVFCGATLSPGGAGLMRTLVAKGRSGLIAASLFGISGLAACDDPGDNPPVTTGDTQTEVQTDATGDGTTADTTPDFIAQPPYGIPPEPDIPQASDATPDAAQDIGPQPAYGIPSDGF